MKRFLKRFLDFNVALSWKTTPKRGLFDKRGFAVYDTEVRKALAELHPGAVVVDVGGGRTFHFEDEYPQGRRQFELWAVDVDAEELALNESADRVIEADACGPISIEDGTVDLILCRAGIEHFHNTAGFVDNCRRLLKPSGHLIVTFANTWAPSSVLNRIVPPALARTLLFALVPNSKGYQGFKAHYDNCSFRQFEGLLLKCGFVVERGYCSYYGSSYFQFCFPLHTVSIAADLVRQFLGWKQLSSMNLFVAGRC